MTKRNNNNRKRGNAQGRSQSHHNGVETYAEREAIHELLHSDLGDGPQLIRSIECAPRGDIPRARLYADRHQRWLMEELTIHYVPSVTMAAGMLAINVSSPGGTVPPTVAPGDVVSFVESGGPSKCFRVTSRMSFKVPSNMLKGITRDGWHNRVGCVSIPCFIQIFQMADLETVADSQAVQSLNVIGTFWCTWKMKCRYQAPLAPGSYPAASHLSSSVLPLDIPDGSLSPDDPSLKWTKTSMTLHNQANARSGGSFLQTVEIELHRSTLLNHGFNFILPSNEPDVAEHEKWIIGVDLMYIDATSVWRRVEDATEAMFPDFVEGDGRLRSAITDYIENKVVDAIGAYNNPGLSLWSVTRDVGALLARIFIGKRQSAGNEQWMDDTIDDALTELQNASTYVIQSIAQLQELHRVANIHGTAHYSFWFVGIAADAFTDPDEQNELLLRTVRNHYLNVTKWISTPSQRQAVFYPGAKDPDIAQQVPAAHQTVVELPSRDAPTLQKATVAGFSGHCMVMNPITTQKARIQFLAEGDDSIIDISAFPLYDGREVIGTVDLDNPLHTWTIQYSPLYFVDNIDSHAAFVASGDSNYIAWLKKQVSLGTSGYYDYTNYKRRIHGGQDNDADSVQVVPMEAIDYLSSPTPVDYETLFPILPVTYVQANRYDIICTCTATANELVDTVDYSFEVTPKVLTHRQTRTLSHARAVAASSYTTQSVKPTKPETDCLKTAQKGEVAAPRNTPISVVQLPERRPSAICRITADCPCERCNRDSV